MKLNDIISRTRNDFLNDIVTPYQWSDATLAFYANEAEKEACRRSELLIDKTTSSICSIAVTSGTADYTLNKKVIRVINIVPASDSNIPLKQKLEGWLDEFYYSWRTAEGETAFYYLQDGRNIQLIPKPNASDTLALKVVRLPLADMFIETVLSVGTTKTRVAHTAFQYIINEYVYNKTEDAVGTALSAVTVPQNKYGIWKGVINIAGTITYLPGAGNATGYTTEALAIAALPATPTNQAYFGYWTVVNTSAAFVAGTTNLDASGVTVNFVPVTSSPEIPEEYHFDLIQWVCKLAYDNQDVDRYNPKKALEHEMIFERRFGSRPSAIAEVNKKRIPRNLRQRPAEFGF